VYIAHKGRLIWCRYDNLLLTYMYHTFAAEIYVYLMLMCSLLTVLSQFIENIHGHFTYVQAQWSMFLLWYEIWRRQLTTCVFVEMPLTKSSALLQTSHNDSWPRRTKVAYRETSDSSCVRTCHHVIVFCLLTVQLKRSYNWLDRYDLLFVVGIKS